MRIVEQYYGPCRRGPLGSFQERDSYYVGNDMECYIQVEVNGRLLQATQFLAKAIPAKDAFRICRRAIMVEVEKEVFGG